ncbi:MAG: glutamine-hydrolyzing GMP synthase [Endozoicomonadaceae bacterium]|nr:glutamine-hydrolyzing GMP synthase [Endozoicomonadaceae bacterium]
MCQTVFKSVVLILDFGSQYTQLIARRVREIGVYCEIVDAHVMENDECLKHLSIQAIILSGGPESTIAQHAPTVPEWIFQINKPILGVCYGMQVMALRFGGKISQGALHEFGEATLKLKSESALWGNESSFQPKEHTVWMSHGDQIIDIPEDFKLIASTENCPFAAISHQSKPWYGLQFHPEVTHTLEGIQWLTHFVVDIAGCEKNWMPDSIIAKLIEQIRKKVGSSQVLLGLSGGVDSSVLAALLHRAIGDQLVCVFVDNGLLRLHEAENVLSQFKTHMGLRVVHVDASNAFLEALEGISDPELKRKVIGQQFIDIFEQEALKLKQVTWLAQGTIYPDVIESAGSQTGKAHVIKSHHNVGGLPSHMTLNLIEPLRLLFKDEVRKIGLKLKLPDHLVYRHPFPGPGLSVRILGEVKYQYILLLRQVDAIFMEELQKADLYYKVNQAFAVFLPIKSVGVVGDARLYSYVVSLRAVETIDFMTARWAHLPYEFLSRVSSRIMNEVHDIARVTYDISDKPPATIEWE